MDNRKECPYCGEDIAASAKKCRFCGEWFEGENALQVPETVETEIVRTPQTCDPQYLDNLNRTGELPSVVNINGVPQYPSVMPNQQYPAQPYQAPNTFARDQTFQQPVINIQLAQKTEVKQEANQTVIVEKGSSSSTGFLWVQLAAVGGAVWWGTGHWWAGLITWIVLAACTQIPVVGTILCIILGAGVGLLAGIIAAAFSAPTWACWLIGFVVGMGTIGLNIEDKDSDD